MATGLLPILRPGHQGTAAEVNELKADIVLFSPHLYIHTFNSISKTLGSRQG